jgi:AcrR family transcriptional regulator
MAVIQAKLHKKFNRCKSRVMAGLREAKKARTRQAISNVATRLFAERGFETVTLAEIAEASDVSVKTIFNYFASKEDLFFDRADELIEGLVATIEERAPGTTVTEALYRLLHDNVVPFPGAGWSRLDDARQRADFRAFLATEAASPALRARRLVVTEQWREPLAKAVGGDPPPPAALVYASLVLAIMGVRERTLSAAVLGELAPKTVRKHVQAVVDEGFARLARAYDDPRAG